MNKYIEYIIDKIRAAYSWILSKIKLDKNKLDINDLIAVYDMVMEFAKGGTDGVIDATDVAILVKRLEELIASNKL